MTAKKWLTGAVHMALGRGCASTQTPSTAPKLQAGAVALVPARYAPERFVYRSPEQSAVRSVLDGAADQRLQIGLAIGLAQHADAQIRSVVELCIRHVSVLTSSDEPPQAAECRLVASELDKAVSQLAQQAADALLSEHR